MNEIIPYLPGLSPVENKQLCARFDGGRLSSDGGVLLLRGIERRLGSADLLASCMSDARDPASTTHTYADMMRARMFAIACGYEDCDDLDALRFDPAFKLACGRLSETGDDLMSQPTLSRLENAPSWRQLARMGLIMIDLFCASFKRVPERIVLDIDDTADTVHGGQQLALFNAYHDSRCFQPIHIYEAATGKPVAVILRPGKTPGGVEVARVLRHVVGAIRARWPRVDIVVRGDSHYARPQAMDWLERNRVGYVFGLATNPVLRARTAELAEAAALARLDDKAEKVRRFAGFAYAARSCKLERRIVARIEAAAQGGDSRFIVTNLAGTPQALYEKLYCARGQMENLIKAHKLHLASDRTACSKATANQFRLLIHTAAYWLMHTLRGLAPKTSFWRDAQFDTIRLALIKVAGRVTERVTRIKLSLPSGFAYRETLTMLAARAAKLPP